MSLDSSIILSQLAVRRLQGQENFNALYEYRLELAAPDALSFKPDMAEAYVLDGWVGTEASVAIELEGAGSYVAGAVGGSALSLQQLAQHLRCFTVFNDSDAEPYGLRLADCRVLHYLPQILTLPQWQALTAPMCAWQAHTRAGEVMVFPFERDREPTSARNDAVPQPLQLNAAQIAALMEASEPDSLFAHLHWAPEDTKPAQWQLNYDIAQRCIQVWQQYAQENPQRCDRRVLFGLTKQALATQGVWLHQPLKVEQILQEIAEKIS